MSRYNPPANVDDFSRGADQERLAGAWNSTVEGWIAEAAARSGGVFFDARDSVAATVPVAWDAFPQTILSWCASEPDPERARHEFAETLKPWKPGGASPRAVRDDRLAEPVPLFRRQQDEYCEWFTHRNENNQVTRIDFTCEGPEYWRFLAENDPDLCLSLYREHVDPHIEPGDLFWSHPVAIKVGGRWVIWKQEGEYNDLNKWTTTHGVMHLTHEANTLEAEVNLAADATILRAVDGAVVDDPTALICCAGFGGASRSSDPVIGFGVNRAVANGNIVGLADPVGLYIAQADQGAFTDEDGTPVDGWSVTRGDEPGERILRATFTPPADTTVLVGGNLLDFGGQIADHIQMALYAVVEPSEAVRTPEPCIASCCVHPTRPGFRVVQDVDADCSLVGWQFLAPIGPRSGSPDLASDGDAVEDLSAIVVTEHATIESRR